MNSAHSLSSKKLAFILPSLGCGGAERSIVCLANQFSRRGCDVTIICLCTLGHYYSEVDNSISVICLNKKKSAFAVFHLSRVIKAYNFNSIVSAITHVNVISVVSLFLSRSSSKILVTERDTLSVILSHHKPIQRFLLVVYLYYLSSG